MLASSVAAQPPPNLAKLVAAREAQEREARMNYTYRQEVLIEEMAPRGGRAGDYRETREVVFSPETGRIERMVGKPFQSLVRLRLTDEDFRDIRDVQPFLFTSEDLWLYETRFKGEEAADGVDCWLLQVRPRQTHQGQRLFDGILWVDKRDYSVFKTEGVAVPQMFSKREENLFPRFTTFRDKVDGHWFPVHTHSDDTLPFANGPLRMRMSIKYLNYRKFSATSSVTFDAR
ncbi:MAG: outer membrane lipoprotein-sorting protein [Acidobacteria bacterium]|nr:outer membrane lipoprotein-sorting protein [Acidobacteriota bacterium]